MSSGFTTSAILTSAEMDCPPSFTPFEMAICECSSMMPLVKCSPFASTTLAPAGAAIDWRLTLMIFPSCTSTSAPTKIPSFSLVQTVASLNKIVLVFCTSVFPKAIFGNHTAPLCKVSGFRLVKGWSSVFLF